MNTNRVNARRAATWALPLVTAAGVGLLAGCTSEPGSRVVSAPPPSAQTGTVGQTVVVPSGTAGTTTAPAATTASPGATVVVQQSPPAVQQENAPPRPSEDHVWVSGFWAWRDDRYHWVPGQWVVPPYEGAVWVPPRWEPEGQGYRFYDGYWDD